MNDRKKSQRGGFAVGLVIGLLIGLALALGVALYVTKVPIPFVNKVPQRSADQDAAETQKNKNWDPNSPLYGKNPAKPNGAASGTVAPLPPVATPQPGALPAPAVTGSVTPAAPRASAPSSARDPAAILADKPAAPMPAPKITASASAAGGTDPFSYFVQAGAYGRTEDAEAQRAKLAMLGMEGRLTEREQAGRTVYRVRLGPFEKKADAEAAKERLAGAGVEAALVRVQR
ncbi:MAG TPA: SPOR domain-containing protein [Burkholderiaceae bacterium]|nr:SPOR domain-containing protein [Burkholderiaceae bacterium]